MHTERAIQMLKIAARWINENGGHFGATLINYDGADCDGSCIATDCEHAAECLEMERPSA